jgi:catechol 2,3-dioxygenase-like lactoylglutathione lyase family enzyme
MSFNHVALATRDLLATHRFYTDAMGFDLVHVEGGDTEHPGGWFRHAFYDTGDGSLLAFMELHDERCTDFDPGISSGLGLPVWVNHLAFDAPDLDALAAARDRWLEHGIDVMRMEHTHGVSVYATDPNGTMIEWACCTRPFGSEEQRAALARLTQADLPHDAPTAMEFFTAAEYHAQ